MSTLHTNQPSESTKSVQTLRACTITWPIARQGVLKAQPDLGFSSTSAKPIELRIRIESETKARAELFDPADAKVHTLELGAPRLTFVDAANFTHIELTDAQTLVLSATIKREDTTPRLIYARSSLLTQLNIKGGRYPAPTLST